MTDLAISAKSCWKTYNIRFTKLEIGNNQDSLDNYTKPIQVFEHKQHFWLENMVS